MDLELHGPSMVRGLCPRHARGVARVIAILEDDRPRREAMASFLPPGVEARWFDRAPDLIAWLAEHLAACALISLDHDLLAPPGVDPGTGRDVADHLATRAPGPPVLVHTSNGHAAPGMMWTLERAGWQVVRVVPFSDLEWIERSWARAVERALDASNNPT